MVPLGIILLVIDPEHNCDVLVLGWSRDDHFLRASVEVSARFGCVGEESR